MCIVHSNHCNVIVGVFNCSSLFHFIRLTAVSPFLFISYDISRGALDDAPRSTRVPRSPGWETLKIKDLNFYICVYFQKNSLP